MHLNLFRPFFVLARHQPLQILNMHEHHQESCVGRKLLGRLFFLAAALLIVFIAAAVVTVLKPAPMQPPLDWNLSDGFTLDRIDWPSDMVADGLAGMSAGRRRVRIVLSDNHRIDSVLNGVYARKEGRDLSRITLEFEKADLNSCVKIAGDLIREFDYDTKTLVDWAATQQSKPNYFRIYRRSFVGNQYNINIRARYSFDNSKPWIVWLDLYPGELPLPRGA